MLAEQVDGKLLARLGEPHEAVEVDNVRKDAVAFAPVGHVEEATRHVAPRARERAVLCRLVKVVYLAVLAMEGGVQDVSAGAFGLEHAVDKERKVDETVVQLVGDGPDQLHFVCLEAGRVLATSA